MNKKTREDIITLLSEGKDIPAEYQDELFPLSKKEYELVYAGKERKEVILNDTMSVPFQTVKHFGDVKEGDWANMLIFGDNLQALKHLLKLKREGKLRNPDGTDGVKLVYIDPPFGTGDEYDGNKGQSAYSAKLRGRDFIEFLRKRIILLYDLLSDDGVIFVRIDYHFGHYIRVVLDEIFGREGFRNEIVINRFKRRLRNLKQFNHATDTFHFYAKNENNKFTEIFRSRTCSFCGYEKEPEWHHMVSSGLRNPPERIILGRKMLPPKGQHWKYKQSRIDEMEKEGRIRILDNRTYVDLEGNRIKGVPEFLQTEDIPVDSVWTDLKGYEFNPSYPTQNPEELIERVVRCSSSQGDLVLDCFAGSGTTGAVAEKLGRRWIMVDCGKLAIYTMQKRLMNLKEEIGNKGKQFKPKPFVLINAGLYDDKNLKEQMKTQEYKNFVLELFQCQARDHKLNGITFHGTLNNHSVMVFDKEHWLTEEFIDDLHKHIGSSIKGQVYLIAPAGIVGFAQDYIKKGDKQYTILRIPNSIIAYIREKNFTKLQQPRSSNDINQTIDAVGFDFIYPPKLKATYKKHKPKGKLIDKEYQIIIEEFEPVQLGSNVVEFKDPKAESLAMVMIDRNYDGKTFSLDEYHFGEDIAKNAFTITLSGDIGKQTMIVYLDIFGNERKEIIDKKNYKEA